MAPGSRQAPTASVCSQPRPGADSEPLRSTDGALLRSRPAVTWSWGPPTLNNSPRASGWRGESRSCRVPTRRPCQYLLAANSFWWTSIRHLLPWARLFPGTGSGSSTGPAFAWSGDTQTCDMGSARPAGSGAGRGGRPTLVCSQADRLWHACAGLHLPGMGRRAECALAPTSVGHTGWLGRSLWVWTGLLWLQPLSLGARNPSVP